MSIKIKYIYHEVPKCPSCHSIRTGYYLSYLSNKDEEKLIAHKLQNGEFVRIHNDIIRPEYNCFCEDCDFEWHGKITNKYITKKEFKYILKIKEITNDDIEEIKTSKHRTYKENKEKKKKDKTLNNNKLVKWYKNRINKNIESIKLDIKGMLQLDISKKLYEEESSKDKEDI